ncbi:MAG TPA: response regulator transcription factor [Chloroflexota bacterium]|nr:response regulator transcription factor [Chloroflexota bacterium]
MRVLVVEDELKINRTVCQALREEAYAVDSAKDGEEGEELASINQYDLIILDLLLPKKPGVAVCRSLRDQGVVTPILMLTAKDTVEDRVQGLDSGADDYLVKPFYMDELLARARALLRRETTTKSTRLQVADLQVDTSSHRVSRAGGTIELTSKEYAMLEYFMRNQDQVLTRTMISEHVWDEQFDSLSNIIDVYIRRLRRKIDENYTPRLLHTIRGSGYLLGILPEDAAGTDETRSQPSA